MCELSDAQKGLQSLNIIRVKNSAFLKNVVASEGAISHSVLYYQQLSIARYQVSFYAYSYLSNYQKCQVPLTKVFSEIL